MQIIIVLACSALFWWGGFSWHNARRFILPVVISSSLAFFSHSWWGLTALASIGVFCLGYGEKSPMRHIFGNGWGRGAWGLLAAIALSVGLFLTGHIHWYFFVPYLALNFTLENALKNINQLIGDPIIGAGFASILFIVC